MKAPSPIRTPLKSRKGLSFSVKPSNQDTAKLANKTEAAKMDA
ncbi:MAG: hypothetical protein OEY30_01925 [Candidatus Bathyarchaeota archaeon]|nr:hypothetical protein [Candidatus Bathyarchaeota archaeon]